MNQHKKLIKEPSGIVSNESKEKWEEKRDVENKIKMKVGNF